MAQGWPSCLQVVVSTVLLEKEASKITLGQALEIFTFHQVATLPALNGTHWMTESRIL